MRQLLLGGDSDGSGPDEGFFAVESDDDLGGETELGAMSFSYVPDEKKDLKAQQMKQRMEAGLVLLLFNFNCSFSKILSLC